MPYNGSPLVQHKHYIPSILSTPNPLFTGGSVYQNFVVAKVVVKSLDKTKIHYYFDPFTYGANDGGVTYCNVNLGSTQHGTFEVQFEDENKTIDDSLVASPARCYIYVGKTQNSMKLILSGMIRDNGYERGCNNNLLYYISGYGTGVRTNERILDANEAPNVLEADGSTIDTSDKEFQANKIVDDTFDDTGYFPENISAPSVEGTSGYAYINTAGTTVDSDIKDFMAGVQGRFVEISDIHNQVEDFTGGRITIDTDDRVQFKPILTPSTARTGFLIINNPDLTVDLAANTIYVDQEQGYTWSDSIDKSRGYSNTLYGILPADPVPDVDSSTATNYYENKTVEIAQRFRPPTNPNWRIFAGVEGVGLENVDNENSVKARWRICEDDNGKPLNSGGIVLNKNMPPNKNYNTGDGGLQVIEIMGKGSVDLAENSWYWLILSSVNSAASKYWRWYYNTGNGYVMTASTGTSSDTDGGTGWTATTGKLMEFTLTRFKSEPYVVQDDTAISHRIEIDSNIQSFPQQINTKLAAVKYMINLAAQAARPKRVFDFPSVTIPDNPIFPGDIAYIVDSRFNFSTSGTPAITGQITDINYSFGVKGAGGSRESRGQSSMRLAVISYNQFY